MNQIYNFEEKDPPRLTEDALQILLERRLQKKKLRGQIFLLGMASVFTMLALLLFAAVVFQNSVILAGICIVLVRVILIENGIVGVLFHRRYRYFAYL